MILEAIRFTRDALDDETDGVNRKLAGLEIDAGDPSPPKIKAVWDITTEDPAARGELGMDYPILIVDQDEAAFSDRQGANRLQDANVPIRVLYVTRDPDTADAARDTLYTLRAARQAIQAHTIGSDHEAERVRNSVQIHMDVEIQFGLVRFELTEGAVTGALVVVYQVRDALA